MNVEKSQMPNIATCPYFIGNTFAHLFGGLALTAVSSEHVLFQDLWNKPYTNLFLCLLLFLTLLFLLGSQVGVAKYAAFAVFCILMGQFLTGFVKQLQGENELSKTMIIVGTVFVAMMFIGFADKGNMLPVGNYLFAGLFALVVSMIATSVFMKEKDANDLQIWFSRAIVVLFTLFLAFDVQVLREHAKACRQKPDYVQESLNLYLDIVNLFQGVGGLDN